MTNKKLCGVPFSDLKLCQHPHDIDKIVYTQCCSSFLRPPHNLYFDVVPETPEGALDIMSVWNSNRSIELRKSIIDGSYRYCHIDKCPNYLSNQLVPMPERALELVQSNIFEMDYLPINLQASVDSACNLCCPSCRLIKNQLFYKKSYSRLKNLLELGVRNITLNGSGETFFNRYILNCLFEITKEKYPYLENIHIITNGTLLNNTMWASLPKDFKNLVREILVSVDAANKETYQKVRLGGNFDQLVKNLRLIGGLRKNGEIERFGMAFVLQQANAYEILDFVKLAHDMGVDFVSLKSIENWGLYDYMDFINRFKVFPEKDRKLLAIFNETREYLNENNIDFCTNLW